jgi:DNA recombination protein RmuC
LAQQGGWALLILGLVLGAVVGGAVAAAIAWFAARSRFDTEVLDVRKRALDEVRFSEVRFSETRAGLASAEARLEEGRSRVEQLEADLALRGEQLDEARAEAADLRAHQAAALATAAEERKAAQEKVVLLQHMVTDTEAKFREAFASLSSDALRRNNQSFLELAKETLTTFQRDASGDLERRQQAITEVVKPIRESLDKVDEKIRDIEKQRIDSYATLNEQVRALGETQEHLYAETSNLVRALRTPNVRGRWGEIQLRRVVELAGMLEHCDFDEQHTHDTGDGRIRPDLIVRLPGGKVIVVDAKTPLDAYISATEATDDAARAEHMRHHARQVRDHIARLSGKQYWGQFASSPEFVFMFLPGEPLFSAALEHDPSLIEYGVEQRVIPASPTTLIALLRAVSYGWRQEQVARSAQEISALGRTLYERLQTMAGHFEEVRRNLERTVEAYNKTVRPLETRVLVSARRFSELGVPTTDEIVELQTIDRAPRVLHAVPLLDAPEGASDPDEPDPDAPPRFLRDGASV